MGPLAVLALVAVVQSAPKETPPTVAPAAAGGKAVAASRMDYFTFDSKTLKQPMDAGVYLPAGYDDPANQDERYPVVYFLHGLWLNARNWEERGANRTLDKLIEENQVAPMIVVCADGKRDSMWVDWLDGSANWGDYLATELVATIDAKYRTLADRATRAISGESMGGYGALNLAFKHPDVFSAVSTMSAAIYPVDPSKLPPQIQQFAPRWKPVYGWPIDADHWKKWNPLELAETLPAESLGKLAIYFDCGKSDRYGFDQTNAQLHEILEKRKVAHEWTLRDGGHGHAYFEEYVGQTFLFHGKLFDAAQLTPKQDAPKAQ